MVDRDINAISNTNGGTPATSIGFSFKDFNRKVNKKAREFAKKLPKLLAKLIWWIAKVFAGAFAFYFMAGLVPAMREMAPNFYQIVDLLIHTFDKMCELLTHWP